MTAPVLLAVLGLAALVLVGLAASATMAMADTAHRAASRSALERALEDHPRERRRAVLAQHEDAERTLAAIEAGAVLAAALVVVSLGAIVQLLLAGAPALRSIGLGALVGVVGGALLVFLARTVAARLVARRGTEVAVISVHRATTAARTVLGPLAGGALRIGAALTPGTGAGPYESAARARREIDRALENEHLEADERSMIHGVVELSTTMVRELMVPRTDMVSLPAGTSASTALRTFVRSGFSRMPVVGESLDDLRGMLYVKDVIREVHSPWDPRPDLEVEQIMRPARFVPEFVPADEVLRQMQASHVHIAVVVDEYGGVSGIVTIEDVVEEIVGEIADEHDPQEPGIMDLGDGRFRVPAREGLSEVGDLFGLTIEDPDVDSIGGLLGKAIGRVPIVGSRGDIAGLRLEAEKTSGRRRRLSTLIVSRSLRTDDDPDERPLEDDDDR
ncbi:hemolysin family protein [Brachybacterium sp. DNPG3]